MVHVFLWDKRAFTQTCRPFIGLDRCHIKNKYGGILLIIVGKDPIDQYFPIYFGVVENETKDSWSWFIKLLLEDIGDCKQCFISDYENVFLVLFFVGTCTSF